MVWVGPDGALELCFNYFLKGQDAGVLYTHTRVLSSTAPGAGEQEGGEGGICRGREAGPLLGTHVQGTFWNAHKFSPHLLSLARSR